MMNRYLIFIPEQSLATLLMFTVVARSKQAATGEVKAFYKSQYGEEAPASVEVRVVPKSEGVVQLTNLRTTYVAVERECEYNYTPKIEYA